MLQILWKSVWIYRRKTYSKKNFSWIISPLLCELSFNVHDQASHFFCFTVIFALARPFQAFENVFQRNKFCFMQMFHKQQAFQLDQVLHHHWHQCVQTWFHSSSLQPSQLEQQRKLRFGQNFVQTQSWGSVSVASFHHMLEVSHSMRLENWKQTVKAKRKVSLCNHQISDSLSLYALYF